MAQSRRASGPGDVAHRELKDHNVSDNIESLATELLAMEDLDPLLSDQPVEDWRHVNLRTVADPVWFYVPSDRRPDYCQGPTCYAEMTPQELQHKLESGN